MRYFLPTLAMWRLFLLLFLVNSKYCIIYIEADGKESWRRVV
jgi:hypothetical protein